MLSEKSNCKAIEFSILFRAYPQKFIPRSSNLPCPECTAAINDACQIEEAFVNFIKGISGGDPGMTRRQYAKRIDKFLRDIKASFRTLGHSIVKLECTLGRFRISQKPELHRNGVERDGETPKMEELVQCAVRKGMEPLAKEISRNTCSANRQNEAITNLVRAYNGDSPASPHARSPKNQKVVDAAIRRRWELINGKGRDERMATTDACNEIESEMGRGNYKTSGSFRDAVATKIRQMRNLGLDEVEINAMT